MRRAMLGSLALVLVAVACDATPTTPMRAGDGDLSGTPLAAARNGSSVRGAGSITFGQSEEHLSVDASGMTGRAVFHDKAAGGNFNGQIDVNCVNIVGNTATVSGIVTHSNDPALEGSEAVFQIVDNGDGGKGSPPDFMSLINFHAVGTGTDCRIPAEFDLAPVKGDFTVQP